MQHWFIKRWYSKQAIIGLLPLSWLYQALINLRYYCYHRGWFRRHKIAVPVIVVGNITVGGTGKTPVVIWLAKQLQQHGFKPGIISRGYGRKASQTLQLVSSNSSVEQVGDEPLLIYRQTQCPVVVARQRVEAAEYLLAHNDCDVIISDDGMQHYALQRDIEVMVIDGSRRYGNGYCLPAGPLREPIKRIQRIDYIIAKRQHCAGEYLLTLQGEQLHKVNDVQQTQSVQTLRQQKIHAIAGIGHPEQFFQSLRDLGLDIIEHPFPDHHQFTAEDIDFGAESVIMTEKDAVKCQTFTNDHHWYLPVKANIDNKLANEIIKRLAR